ncbi:hypothetical protein G6F63_016997 [Rhizopus arrhizus]|uniref:Uncharacterized protein n=1 Tax=Rhizopus delemar TaxID=936053 RepID=A0A9P7BZP8_9FUNG|nr:hypothetical protein G6F63_016997 [Rhizopus arrhizus]KAG1529045.1 hypothetical protein G6F50_018203 [Rhizopus delemar]
MNHAAHRQAAVNRTTLQGASPNAHIAPSAGRRSRVPAGHARTWHRAGRPRARGTQCRRHAGALPCGG